jgi:uncharacterized protein (DUF433 family)
MTPSGTAHIVLDERGRPWIDDTNTKVIEVVLDRLVYQWSPEAIQIQHPHLSLAQIHAALSYYYDHKAEIDAEIERQDREYQEALAEQRRSPEHQRLMEKLRATAERP